MEDRTIQVAIDQFKFLIKEYSFELYQEIDTDWGWKLGYKNSTTGVLIKYEYREAYLFISVHMLEDGQILKSPRSIDDNTKIFGFSLDDIIRIENKTDLLAPLFTYDSISIFQNNEDGFSKYIKAFAVNLKKYGYKILNGDFDIFPQIEKSLNLEQRNINKLISPII